MAALLSLWLLAVNVLLGTVGMDWNAARLAPTFALVHGYRLYYPATDGPILNHLYGPVAALAFLPATLFRTPTAAILAGGSLQLCFVLGPLLLFAWRAGGTAVTDRCLSLACGLGACLLMARYQGTSYWLSMVHADGPALGLGMLACAALVSRDGTGPTRRALLGSATAAILAGWAKQTAAAIPFALLLALWLAHGRVLAVRYAAMLAGIGVALSAIFLAWCDGPLFFNMVQLVSRHPWLRPGAAGLAETTWLLLRDTRGVLVLLVAALAVVFVTRSQRRPVAGGPWVSALLVAVFLLPTGALGANKIGGEPSSFHSVYYLIAAIAALLADAGRRATAPRMFGWAFCVIGVLAAWQSGWSTRYGRHVPLWQNNNQLAYEFALRHPGEAYFPWQPLASLLAEGRLYHFEYGMFDRSLGGYEPTPEHIRAYVPPRLRWIAARNRLWTFKFFPEFSEPVQLPELPGWVVMTRPPS